MNEVYINFSELGDDNEKRFNHYYWNDTNVLKNFLNIRSNDELNLAEKYFVSLNYKKAREVKGKFDFFHLIAIHLALFGDIYPFAGKLRQANMGKTSNGETYYDVQKTMFMDYKEIPYHIGFFDQYMASKNYLSNIKDKTLFSKEVCEIYLFINDIHAFREGNGRAQNEFIRQLAEKNGYILDIQGAMERYKYQGVNYYLWFYNYQATGNKDEILNNLFRDNILTKQEYQESLNHQFS